MEGAPVEGLFMNRRLRTSLVAVCATALLVSCGGEDSESADAQPYVDAVSEAVTAGQIDMDEEQSQCFGEGFVDVVGLDKLEDTGTPEEIGRQFQDLELVELELSQGEGEDVYDTFESCGYDMRADLLDSLFAGQKMAEETQTCIEDAVDEDKLRSFVVTMMTEGSEAAQESEAWQDLEAALIACEPAPAAS